ncbi:hypothetical protein B0H13DRAFT_1887367 [Mycena leptocephala]|nr:hypothetical protein B0H13DRAFT_1887367 [Mycena leptocephala]
MKLVSSPRRYKGPLSRSRILFLRVEFLGFRQHFELSVLIQRMPQKKSVSSPNVVNHHGAHKLSTTSKTVSDGNQGIRAKKIPIVNKNGALVQLTAAQLSNHDYSVEDNLMRQYVSSGKADASAEAIFPPQVTTDKGVKSMSIIKFTKFYVYGPRVSVRRETKEHQEYTNREFLEMVQRWRWLLRQESIAERKRIWYFSTQ